MKAVYVAKTEVVSALGNSLDETWNSLCAGESAVKKVTRFNTERIEGEKAACVEDLGAIDGNGILFLLDKLLERLGSIDQNTCVIWTGIKGGVEHIESLKQSGNEVKSRLAGQYRQWIKDRLGIQSQGMDINAACVSSAVGIALGADLIRRGEFSRVLVVGADLVTRFTFTGFAALRALSKSDCRPFDADRDGLALGEAAAAILLSSDKENALAKVSGWGIANDANHITGPDRNARGLTMAIESALAMAAVKAADVAAYCAHGTATVYNDAMELTGLERVFGDRRFPLFSIKGAAGHTLGAAGAFETAVCVKALKEEKVPPTFGLNKPEDRAQGRASSECAELTKGPVLTSNSGFGGLNAALLLEACQ